MPNGVKYSTTTPTGSLRRDNVALGVTGNLGPTANTGFYSMPTPASGKYIINKVAASGVPLFFAPQSDTELIQFAKNEGATGADTGSAAAVLAWIATQPNLEAANFQYENIVTDGLLFNVDAGFVGSYPSINTTWYDISGNGKNGTLINGTSYNSSYSGSLVFDGIDDYAYFSNISSTFPPQGTVSFWMWADVVENYRNPLQFTNINGSNVGIRFEEYTPGDQFHGGFNALFGNNSNFTGYRYLPYPGVLTANTWYNVVLAWDTSTSNIVGYLNNDLKFNANDAIYSPTNINNLVVGTGFSMDRCWKGRISGVMIYTKQLSSTEVSQNYNAQKSRFGL
jgi:hypothetical protein